MKTRGHKVTYESLSLSKLTELVSNMQRSTAPTRSEKTYMGAKGFRSYNFAMELARYKIKERLFHINIPANKPYDEYVFYNKGSLYRVRHYSRAVKSEGSYYELWYGTKKLMFVSTIAAVLKEIPIPVSYESKRRFKNTFKTQYKCPTKL